MNVSELKSDTDFLAMSTSATYADADKVRNMNVAYNDVTRQIWESQGGWYFDDSNATTLPVAKTTLVHNQQDYELPSTAQRVRRLEIMDGNGAWVKLEPLDMGSYPGAMPEVFGGGIGQPTHYSLEGRSIMLYPVPHSAYVTETSGMAVYMDRDITEMAVTATTTSPGFAKAFHRILSLAAAIDFTQDDSHRAYLLAQKDRLEKGLTRFYSKRAPEIKARIRPKTKRTWKLFT